MYTTNLVRISEQGSSDMDVSIYLEVLSLAKKRYEDYGGSLQSVFTVRDVMRKVGLDEVETLKVILDLTKMGWIERLGTTKNYSITIEGIEVLKDENEAKEILEDYISQREKKEKKKGRFVQEEEPAVPKKTISDKDIRNIIVLTIKVLLEEIEASGSFSLEEKRMWKELFKTLTKSSGFLWNLSNRIVSEFKKSKEEEYTKKT